MKTETLTLFHFDTLHAKQLIPFQDEKELLIQVFTSLHNDLDTLQRLLDTLSEHLPHAIIIGATTDGEIESGNVYTNSTIITFSSFDASCLTSHLIEGPLEEKRVHNMISEITTPQTKLLLTFSDGTTTNGENYLQILHKMVPDIPVAGGMAGDGAEFTQTYIIHQNSIIAEGSVMVAVDSEVLYVKTDYTFDWQPLGREMIVTKADENRVYEIDDTPTMEIYGKYLGAEIKEALPNIGIEFPLLLRHEAYTYARAPMAKFDDGSLAFAGNLSVGDRVTLGFADMNEILHHSFEKAQHFTQRNIETFFIYSCMARRRFMEKEIHTEIEPFAAIAPTAGFFTYGEFYHHDKENQLFNETMTFVALSEDIDKKVKTKYIKKAPKLQSNRTFKALSNLFKATQAEYEFNNQLLDTVVKTGQIGYFVRNHFNDTIHFSGIAVELFGVHNDSKQKSGYYALMILLRKRVHPEDRKEVFKILHEASKKQTGYSLNCRLVMPDNKVRYIKMITHLSFDLEGLLHQTVGTIYDLTELKEEQRRHEELSFLIENSLNEVYVIDAEELHYLYANTRALNVLGYDLNTLSTLNIYDTNPDMTPEKVALLRDMISEKEMIINESIHQSSDGLRYPTRSQIYHTHYSGRDAYVIFSTDITQEKLQEEHEEALKKTLENVLDYSGTYFLLANENSILHANKALLNFLDIPSVDYLSEHYHCAMDLFEDDTNYFSAKKLGMDCSQTDCLSQLLGDEILGVIKHGSSGQKRVMKLNINQLPNQNYIISMTDVTEIEQEAKRFEYQANHDKLTGAYNRSYLEYIYQTHLDNYHDNGIACSFILLDIDDFKNINDNYGHLTGDRVLILLSNVISQKIRHDDVFVRWGGEEFLLLLPKTSYQSALKMAEILRQEVSRLDIGIDRQITSSFGVSSCQEDDTKETLFQRLDKALYAAKKAGKNCVKSL